MPNEDNVYAEFLRSFQADDDEDIKQRFVQGGVISADSVQPIDREQNAEYFNDAENKMSRHKKGPSEIEKFLKEIKEKQEKHHPEENGREELDAMLSNASRGVAAGTSNEEDDSTNLFISNLPPETTEDLLCREFSKFGQISSVKIMYPKVFAMRRLNGFCSFETRAEADAARTAMDGYNFHGSALKVGWGRPLQRPYARSVVTDTALRINPHPLGFQPVEKGFTDFPAAPPVMPVAVADVPLASESTNLEDAIRVEIPKNLVTKCIIDTVARHVADHGFELEREIVEEFGAYERFAFMLQPRSSAWNYYAWKTFSFAQGDSLSAWRTEPFQMVAGRSVWVPPSLSEESSGIQGVLRGLNRSRPCIAAACEFVLCGTNGNECTSAVAASLLDPETSLDGKLARLYLLSDLLHNSCFGPHPLWLIKSEIEKFAPDIFNHFNKVLAAIPGRVTHQALKSRVQLVLSAWSAWSVFAPTFQRGLESIFRQDEAADNAVLRSGIPPLSDTHELFDSQIDGEPLDSPSNLSILPLWLRESTKQWSDVELEGLQRICKRNGLGFSDCSNVRCLRDMLIRRLQVQELYSKRLAEAASQAAAALAQPPQQQVAAMAAVAVAAAATLSAEVDEEERKLIAHEKQEEATNDSMEIEFDSRDDAGDDDDMFAEV